MDYESLYVIGMAVSAGYLAAEAHLAISTCVGIYRLRKALRESKLTAADALELLKRDKDGWNFMLIAKTVLSREIRRTENLYKNY